MRFFIGSGRSLLLLLLDDDNDDKRSGSRRANIRTKPADSALSSVVTKARSVAFACTTGNTRSMISWNHTGSYASINICRPLAGKGNGLKRIASDGNESVASAESTAEYNEAVGRMISTAVSEARRASEFNKRASPLCGDSVVVDAEVVIESRATGSGVCAAMNDDDNGGGGESASARANENEGIASWLSSDQTGDRADDASSAGESGISVSRDGVITDNKRSNAWLCAEWNSLFMCG